MAIDNDIDQEAVVRYVAETYQNWKDSRKSKEDDWTDCMNNYLTIVDQSKYESWPWRSKVCDTFSQEIGDTAASLIKNALFPFNDDFFKLEGLDEIGRRYQHQMYEYFLKQLHVSRFVSSFRTFCKQIAIVGNSAALTPWVHKTRPLKKSKLQRKSKSGYVKNIDEVLYDGFVFRTQDIFDVVVNPRKPYEKDSPIFFRTLVSLTELKNAPEGLYQNLDRLEADYSNKKPTDSSDSQKAQRAQMFGLLYEPSEDEVEIILGFGDFIIDGRLYQDYLIAVGNREVLLRCEENPYWGGKPAVFAGYDNLWFSPYGRGPLEPVRGIQELINTFSNQKADILNLIIMGNFAYVNDGVIDPDNLILRPGGGVEVGDINNIKPLHPSTNVALTYQEIAMLRDRGDKSSAVSDYQKGGYVGARKSAYEASIIHSGGTGRFSDIIKHIGETVVEDRLQFFLESVKQFKYGSKELPDEAFLGEYKIDYFGADMSLIRQQWQQQLATMGDIIGRSEVFSEALEPTEFLEEWRKALNIRNARIIRSKEAMEAIMARKEALAQAEQIAMQAQMQRARGEAPRPQEEQPPPELLGTEAL